MTATDDSDRLKGTGERVGATLQELHGLLGRLSDEAPLVPQWPQRIEALRQRLIDLSQRATDELLFVLIAGATRMQPRYSIHHALACAVIVDPAAAVLGWGEDERRVVASAALTMNLSIATLQDELAHRERTLTVEQRQAVETHPARSVEQLRAYGVEESLWLDTVEHHHRQIDGVLQDLAPAERLAALLRRVDVFLAKISPRAGRMGLPTTQAARDACLGADGRPDMLGAAILKTLGLYPPGSLVTLQDGDTAVVWQRGVRLDQPVVLAIAGPDRQPHPRPLLRRTDDPAFAVRAPAGRAEARIPWDPQLLREVAREAAG